MTDHRVYLLGSGEGPFKAECQDCEFSGEDRATLLEAADDEIAHYDERGGP